MKMLNDVLVKVARGGNSDLVLIVDNVPEDLFYEMKHPRVVKGEKQNQHWVADKTQAKIPTLYEELSLSQTGDKGVVFDMDNVHAKTRYKALDRYIKSVYPNNQAIPEAISYSSDPTRPSSPALALSQVPRVVLPVFSPAEQSVSGNAAPSLVTANGGDIEAIKKEAVEAYKAETKEKAKAKMAKARLARNNKA